MSEPTAIDPAKLRSTILSIVTVWMTVDDVQREVSAIREKAGEKPSHVPVQLVQQTLAQLVEQGAAAEKREAGRAVVWRLNRAAIVTRRAKVLEHLSFESDNVELEPKLLDATGVTKVDIDELVGQGLVARRTAGDQTIVALAQSVSVQIVARGAEAVVAAMIPSDADDRAVGEDFARKAVLRAEESEARAKKAELTFTRLRVWLADHGIHDIDGIIEPPRTQPARKVYEHTERRPIDDAEKGRILVEVLRLEEAKAVVQLRLDGAKSQGKADLERIDGEIAALKSSAGSSERVVTTKAYEEIDWEAGEVIICALDDDRELARRPIPKGAQKPMTGDAPKGKPTKGKAAPTAEPEQAELPAAAPAPKPKLVELRAAILEVVAASTGLTLEEIAARVSETHSEVPDGVAGLVKVEVNALLKEKALQRLMGEKHQPWRFAAVATQAAPTEPPAAATDGEPGPFASPEQRAKAAKGKGKGKRKGDDEARP